MKEVSILKTESYEKNALKAAIARHFELLGITLARGTRVLIKPNMIMRAGPELAATTHPAVLEAVIGCLREAGAGEICIADSPGGLYTQPLLHAAYKQAGYEAVAQRCGVSLNYDTGSRELRRDENLLCRAFDIIGPVASADYIVNLCKVKTHCMMTFTCGVKNLFGCVPGLLKAQLHYRFPEQEKFARMLIDLSQLVRPQLTIADGVIGMEGNGPTGGRPRPLGVTAAARFDGLYAMDRILSHMIGLTPQQALTVAESIAQQLTPADWRDVTLCGDAALAEQQTPFLMPEGKTLDFAGNAGPFGALVRVLTPHLAPRPIIRTQDCIGCGKCAQICPAQTIAIKAHKAHIQKEKCIRCFCCHEVCPVQAIDVKTTRIFRLFSKYGGKKQEV